MPAVNHPDYGHLPAVQTLAFADYVDQRPGNALLLDSIHTLIEDERLTAAETAARLGVPPRLVVDYCDLIEL